MRCPHELHGHRRAHVPPHGTRSRTPAAPSASCSAASAGAAKCASRRHSRTALLRLLMLATSESHADSSLSSTDHAPSSASISTRLPFFAKIWPRRARAAARSSALRAWKSSSDLIWF